MSTDPDGDYEKYRPELDKGYEEKVERLAQKLLHGGDENSSGVSDIESARKAARRLLEESDARTAQAADLDPDDDDVIRRSSGESAAVGDTGQIPRVTDGE